MNCKGCARIRLWTNLRCCPNFLEKMKKRAQNICRQKGVRIEYPQVYTSVKRQLQQLNWESSKLSSVVNSFQSTGVRTEIRCITKGGKNASGMIDNYTRWFRTLVTVYQSTRRNTPELSLQQYGSKNVTLARNRTSFSYRLGFKPK
jgi:hypothetical protein